MPVENRIIAIRLGFSLTTVSVFLNHTGGLLSCHFRGQLVLPLQILELLRTAD
jgi:hypothetical protein